MGLGCEISKNETQNAMRNNIKMQSELKPLQDKLKEVLSKLKNPSQLTDTEFTELVSCRNSLLVSIEGVKQRYSFVRSKRNVLLLHSYSEQLSKYVNYQL